MAKTVIILGSRREGNGQYLANKIKNRLESKRIISDIIIPGNQKIYICTGCMDCDTKGVCDFKDDMIDNIKKVENADTLIFITPTRWNLISGDLKIFMDRLNPLYTKETLKNKNMIAIEEKFNNCLKFDDIKKQEEKVEKLLDKIEKIL